MDDIEIIELYNIRSETAINETRLKYNSYLMCIADNILHNPLDDEECVNDTYLSIWNSIPPNVPNCLRAFIGKIVRNHALNRLRNEGRYKRLSNSTRVIFDELENVIATNETMESKIESILITNVINHFLDSLTDEKRVIFVRRYWYFDSIKDISRRMNLSESNVKMILKRLRENLKTIMEKEGIV